MADTGGGAVLLVEGLSKTFAGTRALTDVSLEVRAGEVHALVGANGSGKTTLIKTLAGVHRPDPGATVWLDGEELDLAHGARAGERRMQFVHQDLGLILEMSAVDNLAMASGYSRTAIGSIRWRDQRRRAAQLLARFGVDMDLRRPLIQATALERTMVAIAAALQHWHGGRGLLVLDEPTAVLPASGVERLFAMIGEVRRAGTSVLYVSHRLDEIFAIADRVSVLRAGRRVATRNVEGVNAQEVASLIVGRDVVAPGRPVAVVADRRPVALEARGLRTRELHGVDFTLRAGEVLGIAGLVGSGCQALAYAVAGADHEPVDGAICVPGDSADWIDLADAGTHRFPLVPANRNTEGLVAEFDVKQNMTLPLLARLSRRALMRRGDERSLVETWIERLSIIPRRADAPIVSLSGGNQQKVVMARCLASNPSVLVLSEPTAGVDIGTRLALYELIMERARDGLAVVVSSSDTDDIVGMCSRVLVLRDGRVARELTGDEIDTAAIHHAMEGTEPAGGELSPVEEDERP